MVSLLTVHSRVERKSLTAQSERTVIMKELRFLQAASTLEDALYNFTRSVKTLRVELANPRDQARWQQRSPAMAAGLTDHTWTVKELLTMVLVPRSINS
jgi:hypothetical protein